MADLDFSARYSVDGYPGVAFYLRGYATEDVEIETVDIIGEDIYFTYETETVENRSMIVAIMVGDNREHWIDVDDLTPISDDDYCASCGQIGCTHDGRERG